MKKAGLVGLAVSLVCLAAVYWWPMHLKPQRGAPEAVSDPVSAAALADDFPKPPAVEGEAEDLEALMQGDCAQGYFNGDGLRDLLWDAIQEDKRSRFLKRSVDRKRHGRKLYQVVYVHAGARYTLAVSVVDGDSMPVVRVFWRPDGTHGPKYRSMRVYKIGNDPCLNFDREALEGLTVTMNAPS